MRTLLLCVIALCSQVMSMTAQVTGRIEYPHRADYEDQVVLPVDGQGTGHSVVCQGQQRG